VANFKDYLATNFHTNFAWNERILDLLKEINILANLFQNTEPTLGHQLMYTQIQMITFDHKGDDTIVHVCNKNVDSKPETLRSTSDLWLRLAHFCIVGPKKFQGSESDFAYAY